VTTFKTSDGLFVRKGIIVDFPKFEWRGSKRSQVWEHLYKRNFSWGGPPSPQLLEVFRDQYVVVLSPEPYGRLDATDAGIQKTFAAFKTAYDKGARAFCVKFDDIGLTLDKPSGTYDRFGGSYAKAILHYLKTLNGLLQQLDPANTLYWLPQTYWLCHFELPTFTAEVRALGGLPAGIGLAWTGWAVASRRITETDVCDFLAAYGWKEGWPRGVIYDNYGRASESYALSEAQYFAMDGRDSGLCKHLRGLFDERGSCVGRITYSDYLWNPDAYDPERSLKLACRELGGPSGHRRLLEFLRLYNGTAAFTGSASREELVKEMKSKLVELKRLQEMASAAIREAPLVKRIEAETRGNLADEIKSDVECRFAKAAQMERFGWCDVAVKRATTQLEIDAEVEAAWAEATPLGNFVAFVKRNSPEVAPVPPEEQSEVRFLYDGDRLYLLARLKCPERLQPPGWITGLGKVGDDYVYNWRWQSIELFLDPEHDHTNAFQIIIDPLGRKTDQYLGLQGRGFPPGGLWDSGVEVKVKLLDKEWIVEAAIPFGAFKHVPKSGDVWGVLVGRTGAKGHSLCPVVYGGVRGFHCPEHYGHLKFN